MLLYSSICKTKSNAKHSITILSNSEVTNGGAHLRYSFVIYYHILTNFYSQFIHVLWLICCTSSNDDRLHSKLVVSDKKNEKI
jgi:hypothetical protein